MGLLLSFITICDKIFSQMFFFRYTQVLMNTGYKQSIGKGNEAHNVEKRYNNTACYCSNPELHFLTCHFQAKNDPIAQHKIFLQKPFNKFLCTFWPFSLCKIKIKNPQSRSKIMRIPILGVKNGLFTSTFFFRNSIINLVLSTFKKSQMSIH